MAHIFNNITKYILYGNYLNLVFVCKEKLNIIV